MPSFNAPRCQHIKTGGTQCGSPALRGQQFCNYHFQSRPKNVECYEDWLIPGHSGNITLPVFEDAHSIQFVVRQVTQMVLQQKIDLKSAGIVLYGLQIASANLKRMATENPRPTHVVIDLDKVAETPLGMTPWSAAGEGHDPEQEELESEPESGEKSGDESTTPRPDRRLTQEDMIALRHEFMDKGFCTDVELCEWIFEKGPDPLSLALNRFVDAVNRDGVHPATAGHSKADKSASPENAESQPGELPPGTIQACENQSQNSRRRALPGRAQEAPRFPGPGHSPDRRQSGQVSVSQPRGWETAVTPVVAVQDTL